MDLSSLKQGDQVWVARGGPVVVHSVLFWGGRWNAIVGDLANPLLTFTVNEDDNIIPIIQLDEVVETEEFAQ